MNVICLLVLSFSFSSWWAYVLVRICAHVYDDGLWHCHDKQLHLCHWMWFSSSGILWTHAAHEHIVPHFIYVQTNKYQQLKWRQQQPKVMLHMVGEFVSHFVNLTFITIATSCRCFCVCVWYYPFIHVSSPNETHTHHTNTHRTTKFKFKYNLGRAREWYRLSITWPGWDHLLHTSPHFLVSFVRINVRFHCCQMGEPWFELGLQHGHTTF